MTRRFIPLTDIEAPSLPAGCAGCVFWESREPLPMECGYTCDLGRVVEWMREVASEWGECGRVVIEDGRTLGFIKYAPAGYFPQALNMPAGPPLENVPLITCMHIHGDARRHGLGKVLMQAALRDLYLRGERTVQAYGTSRQGGFETSPVVGVQFLLRMGFTVARPHPVFPLMKIDLRAAAAWVENLEAVLESLRIPLGMPRRAPATNCYQRDVGEGLR